MSRAVGRDAVKGDPDAVMRVANQFDGIADEADSIVRRLRRIAEATGDDCWRGGAATAFRARLAEIGPGVTRLGESHREARDALWGYADALRFAQKDDRQAEADATKAVADRDPAAAERGAAARQAFSSEAAALAAGAAAKEAHLLQFTASAAGQVQWHAQLVAYERQQTLTQQRAQRSAAEARGKERGAAQLEDVAKARLTAAQMLAEQAAFNRDVSAHQTVRRLDEAGRTGLGGRNPIEQAWEGLLDKVNEFASSPEFLAALDALDNASAVLSVVGFALLFCGPVGILVGGVLLGISEVLSGAVFLGTLLAFLNHKKTLGDLAWAALGLVPGVKAGAKGAKAGKVVLEEWGGVVKRALYYDDARKAHFLRGLHVAPKLEGFDRKILHGLHIDPAAFYRIHVGFDALRNGHDAYSVGKLLLNHWRQALPILQPIVRPLPIHVGGPIRDALPPLGPIFRPTLVGPPTPAACTDQKVSP